MKHPLRQNARARISITLDNNGILTTEYRYDKNEITYDDLCKLHTKLAELARAFLDLCVLTKNILENKDE